MFPEMTIVWGPIELSCFSSWSRVFTYTTGPRSPPIVPAFSPWEVLQFPAKPWRPSKFNLNFWKVAPEYFERENPEPSVKRI